jgi:hypothetical protein
VLLWVVYQFCDTLQRLIERRKIFYRLLEQPIRKFTTVITEVIDVHDKARLLCSKHASYIVPVVGYDGFIVEELLKLTRPIAHLVILGNGLVKQRHGD